MRFSSRLLWCTLLACYCAAAQAQGYPTRPVRVLVGFTPGGTTDVVARVIAQKLSEQLKQSVVVDNRPGAASLVALNHVRSQPPDGHTIVLMSTTITTLPSLNANAKYTIEKDFTPIAGVGKGVMLLVAHTETGIQSFADLVRQAKSSPGKLNWGLASTLGFDHLGAMGIMRDKDSGDRLHERMNRVKNDDEAAGYLAVALGLMNYQEAKEDINAMLDKATRRDKLLTQCAIGLGLLGDKEVSLKLTARLKEQNPVAVFSALAQGLGFIGDRRSISGLVEPYGIQPEDLPDPLNVFMNLEHDCTQHRWVTKEPVTRPGDYIEFRADLPRNPVGRVLKYQLRDEGVTETTWDREAAGVEFDRR